MELEQEVKQTLGMIRSATQNHIHLGNRIAALETVLSRPGMLGVADFKADTEETKAFDRFIRKGKEALGPEEFKALTVADNPSWGYLCPPEVSKEIIKGIAEFSPIRQIAGVRNIERESLETPKKTGSGAAYWISETGTRTEVTGLAYGMEKSVPYEMAYLAKASMKSLEDAAYDVEGELNQEFVEAFALLEGTAFISGTGAQQPEGLLTNASIATFNSEDADNITADSIISLPYQIKSGYRRNGTWIMNLATIAAVRILKNATTGNYIWVDGFGVQPDRVCGYPVVECPDMPDIGADLYPIMFGDFRKGYLIVDRVGMSVQRLVETYATAGQVGFLARRRVGGHVVLAESLVKMKCAVTA